MDTSNNITTFFDQLLSDIKCHQDTKSYIVGIFGKYKNPQFDLSKDNITLLFAQGQNEQDFLTYQNVGDWLFYSKSMFPEFLKNASEDYYTNIARLSYYRCYRIIKTWQIYEELAENFIVLNQQVKEKLAPLKMSETYKDRYILTFDA